MIKFLNSKILYQTSFYYLINYPLKNKKLGTLHLFAGAWNATPNNSDTCSLEKCSVIYQEDRPILLKMEKLKRIKYFKVKGTLLTCDCAALKTRTLCCQLYLIISLQKKDSRTCYFICKNPINRSKPNLKNNKVGYKKSSLINKPGDF